jgi:hypothetical protein
VPSRILAIKKWKKIENEQGHHVDEESGPQFHIWKFTGGDVIVMLIGGILGGIFSNIVMRIFFE